jgi:hypothetical protein
MLPLSSGRASRQMLKMTSKVVSRERNEANVYFDWRVVIWMALGMTKAVIFFSRETISYIGIESYAKV